MLARSHHLLLDSLVLGLENIEESYGKKYIKIATSRRCNDHVKNEPSVLRS